eukprot:173499-Pleurochrysis_carterae.AAC.2
MLRQRRSRGSIKVKWRCRKNIWLGDKELTAKAGKRGRGREKKGGSNGGDAVSKREIRRREEKAQEKQREGERDPFCLTARGRGAPSKRMLARVLGQDLAVERSGAARVEAAAVRTKRCS